LKQKLCEAECSHLALMVDRSYVIRHISYSQEACVRQMRGQLLGRKCYEVLWNSEKPCSRCPLNKEDPLDVSIIVSHFQQGTTAKIQGTVSESLLPLSNHQNPLFIVLVEPILPLPANRDTAAENSGSIHQTKLRDWISAEDQETTGKEKESPELEALKGALNPSALEDFAGGFRERAYLLHIYYHRLFYPHFSSYGLTHTEQEVALFVLSGLSSKQIAERLFISKKSVDFHRHNIRKKLGLNGKRVSIGNFLQSLLQADSM